MLYSISKVITQELINTYVSDYDIYSYYMGSRFEVGKVFNSPLREDKTPSFGIIQNPEGALIWNDLASGDNGNAITFVKELLGLSSYKQALDRIYDDLVVKGNRTPESTLKPLRTLKNGLKKDLGVQRQRLTKVDKEYWNQFGITPDILKRFRTDSIKYFFVGEYVKWVYTNENPMYLYKVKDKMKIYRPKADKKEKWHGNLTKDFLFGWEQLPKEGKLLIITKSNKDVMCLYGLGHTAIAPPSEGTMISDKFIEEVKQRFDNILVMYDNDEAGRKAANKMADKYELKLIEIPEDSGEKDLTDYYIRYGKENTSILLESIINNAKEKKKTNPSKGRVKNATPNTYNGINFKSKLERYCYEQLTKNNIIAEYEKEKITLMEAFKFKDKAIRAVTYNPDFIGDNFIIECKGYFTEVARLKWKLFLLWMNNYRPEYDVYMPMSISQVDKVIEDILNKQNERFTIN